MKILKRRIIKGQGFVQLVPTEEEDLWHIYNLIQEGDSIKSLTTRKVVQESKSGVKNVKKKTLVLTLKITKITYFASDHLALEIKGQNVQKNDYLSLNQHHCFTVDLDIPISIIKNNWYGYHYKILKEVSDPSNDAEVAAMVMDEGIAHLCFVKPSMTLLKQKVEKSIPKKRAGAEKHETEMKKFYQYCFDALMLTDFVKIQCFIIASPGFIKDEFLKFIKEKALTEQYSQQFKQQAIIQKILAVRSSSGYLNGLNDALSEPEVMAKLQDTKAIKQIKIFDTFYAQMAKDENTVAYSEKDVLQCYKQNAIKTLLISDSIFRTNDLRRRTQFNALVDSVNKQGGETYIFSSLHKSGEKLNNLSGIAAILKFPVYNDDDEDEDDEEEEKKQQQQQKQNNQEKSKKSKIDFESLGLEEDQEQDEEFNQGNDNDDFENFESYQMDAYSDDENQQQK